MSSKIAISLNAPPVSSAVHRSLARGRIFLLAALLGAVLGLAGFWRTYFGPLLAGVVHQPFIVHVHTAVMVTWLLLFIVQVWVAASGRIRLHMRLGPWVMGFALVMVAVGLLVTSEGFARRLAMGDVFRAQRWLFGILRDIVFIVVFLAAGWAYRRRPEIHKRLMLVAATIVIWPAVGRMTFLGVPVPLWTVMLVWPLPVYLAMVHDLRSKRIVHPVYLIGIAAMLTMRLVLPWGASPAWQTIAAHITALYQTPPGHAE